MSWHFKKRFLSESTSRLAMNLADCSDDIDQIAPARLAERPDNLRSWTLSDRSGAKAKLRWRFQLSVLAFFACLPVALAQDQPQPNEQFIPADQLEAVFDRDRRGVLMKREEFKALLEKARANAQIEAIPIPIITEQASLTVTPGDQQAAVKMELRIRQYAEGWQTLRIRAGNLQVEKVEVDGQPALISRDPADPTALLFAHDKIGEFTAVVSMSTQLATLGSDRSAAFQLPVVPAVQLTVNCPAGRHLLVNDLKLERPAAENAATDYVIPVGDAADVRLRWVVQQKETEAQTLVFVRTDGQLQIQKETLRWESDSRISVFGGSINRVVARVPSRLEITSVESTGLEAWTLDDDPDNAGFTRVTMTYRQPFTNDRLVKVLAVAASSNGVVETGMQKIPTLQFAEVTAHTGRLVVTHEGGLRLVSETGGGVRRISAAELGLSTDASVFDFWMQSFELQVAAKPRDRELFVESSAMLAIDDTTATFNTALTIETLNAPLFEVLVNLPADWQLTNVETSPIGNLQSPSVSGLTWTSTNEPNQILVRPAQPVGPGELMTLVLKLTRTISDPDNEQKLALPIVTALDTTTVGGSYTVQFADDLTVAPLSLTGLTPVAGNGTEQVFQNLGTTVSGELSIVRKPSRLAARSVLKTWADSRQQSLDAEIITDVLDGTIRTLIIRLSESLGADVRFEVRSVGPVPGIQQSRAIRPVTIIEQSAGEPADGLRPFTLKLDHRFAGSLSLHAFVQQARPDEATPIAAPNVQVVDAVRQQGVLVFEASPEQRLAVGPEVRSIPGLFVADAGLVDAPDVSTGRRIALTYRFVQPGYAFKVTETRFATDAVPAAVCEQMDNVCTLNDTGSIQRWCQAKIRSSGVQTLRFSLPGGENQSFLWSTMLNGEPVEVRRDSGDYLVAVPPNSESQLHILTVLFESDAGKAGVFGQTEQGPVQFSIDAGDLQAIPIDVLKQSWRVHYPQSSLLVDSDGQFRPTSGVDQSGWLASLGRIAWPETSQLSARLIPLVMFFLMLFVFTVMVSRRRWKTLAAVFVIGFIGFMMTLSTSMVGRPASSKFAAVSERAMFSENLPAPSAASSSDFVPMDAMDAEIGDMAAGDASGVEFGGVGGGMGMGGLGAGTPAPDMAIVQNEVFDLGAISSGQQNGNNIITDPFDASSPSPPPIVASQSPQSPDAMADVRTWELQQQQGLREQAIRKGSARLSVNVNLDVPDDYRSREFVSLADAVHQPSVLSLVVQRQSQIAAIRLLAAMAVILLAWCMRKSAMLWKITAAITLLLLAVGLMPLLSNAWQSVIDGVAIGALISVVMAFACGCLQCCACGWAWFKPSTNFVNKPGSSGAATIALIIAFSSCVGDVGAQETAKETVPQPDVVVPYSPDQPALRADQVFIRHDDFLKLYQQANPDAFKGPVVNPLGSQVVASYLKSGALTPVDGSKQALSFEGRFVVWSDSDQAISVPLPLGAVAIRSVQVDGNEGSVRPLVVGADGKELPNFAGQQVISQQNQAVQINAALQADEGPAYAIEIVGKGFHVVDLKFDLTAQVEGELGRADLPLRSPAAGTLEWTLPADGLDARIQGRTNIYRREGRTIVMSIAQLSTIRLQWLPTVTKVAGDVVYHSTVSSTMSVQDSGIVLRTTVAVNCRQGEISELDVTIPDGYSVQSVSGDDVAGWTAQSTDSTRSVKLQFRRSVNDSTKVTMQLYIRASTPETTTSLPVPISMVRGASRDSGTVILKTGPQFQVRSDSLSAVTQINPNEAPVPEGDELPGRPMLAWRYTRHPASVTVKVTPTADELATESMHAVRLEEQRQLWSSRMTLRISGSPRSRIDIAVPREFLALDVTATALKDWYFSDAVDGDNANADLKTLSIQLMDARSGQLQIAIQGQMNRDVDRNLLNLKAPAVMNATKATSELAVWLDAASESAGIESGVGNGGDWTSKSTASVNACFREISPSLPSLAFQSSSARPGLLAMKLRQAVSTLIAESVTVTNVTETAMEITLALNWQINRAAADHFAIELPTSVASIMTFDVPGQRRVTRQDLGDGRTRVVMQLQQALTDRLFVLGTASLPLPADKVIRGEVPNIVVPQGAPSTLSGQQHFWVLVNQSNGLLQPTAEQPEDKVNPEQITTQIPPQLLQQAVAVAKLRAETAVWNLVYPEQFQVAPAVVSLATHTTVISDDGSWRSRHQLQVTNESRQFLPVVLPKDSRLMYCLVQGRPSRVVIRGEGDVARHLIPIPQSGALASGFEVEFALAGRFGDSAASIRKEWKSERLEIPVPAFPEFRDDPEFGIQVSRNRWSVFVPESWRATLVEDPGVTNVVRAASAELRDASLMSEVEQASILLNNVKSAKSNFARRKAIEEVQNKTDLLRRYSGNDSGVEQQRGEVLSKLSDLLSNDLGNASGSDRNRGGYLGSGPVGNSLYGDLVESQASGGAMGNTYLFEQEQGQNGLNFFNNDAFIKGNRGSGLQVDDGLQGVPQSNKQSGQPSTGNTSTDDGFRKFGITQQDFPELDNLSVEEFSKKESAIDKSMDEKSGSSKSGESKSERYTPRFRAVPAEPRSGGRDLGESKLKDGVEFEGVQSRSQLMKRRSAQPEVGKPQPEDEMISEMLQRQETPMDMPDAVNGNSIQDFRGLIEQKADADRMQLGLVIRQSDSAPSRSATPTGLLSLKFEIPTDGQQIDFLRVGGNPTLALDVRSSVSVSKGLGLLWLAICVAGMLLLTGPGRRGQAAVFCLRFCIILTVAGLAAWLCSIGDVRSLGLLICIAGAIGTALASATLALAKTA